MVTETEMKIEMGAPPGQEERPLVVGAASKLMLAAIGAVGLAQDALEDLLDRMVERGELSQNDARKLVNQLRAKSPRPFRHGTGGQTVAAEMEEAPTKADIQSLHAEIAALSAKLDQIKIESAVSPKPAAAKAEVPPATPPKPTSK
jgi:polyhydroxyalkanoate synthesis regulator phasin